MRRKNIETTALAWLVVENFTSRLASTLLFGLHQEQLKLLSITVVCYMHE